MSDRWQDRAACTSVPTRVFYGDVWSNEWTADRPPESKPVGLAIARSVCMDCSVRRECLLDELAAEQGNGVTKRYGLYALTTPHQRVSIEKRGPWPRCDRCGQAADPAEYLAGGWTCCRHQHTVATLPDIGDEWYQRHTKLSIRILAWVRSYVDIDGAMPSVTHLAKELNARTADVSRIYSALVDDGTLVDRGKERPRYLRVGRLGAAAWSPQHLHA